MAILDQIQARILIDREVAKEYEHHDSPSVYSHAARCIHGEPGQSFIVEVGILEGYNLEHAPYLLIEIYCDGFEKASRRKCNTLRIPAEDQIVTQSGRIASYEYCRAQDDRSGQRFKYQYVFGALESTVDGALAAALTPTEAEDLGSIRISVCRALRARITPRPRRGQLQREVDRVCEKDLDGRSLTSSIQRVLDEPAPQPAAKQYRYLPLPGVAGEKTRFTYFYRSKRPLQGLGLMPRTPSPPNPFDQGSSIAGIARTHALIRRKQQELAELNASVANEMLDAQGDDYDPQGTVRRSLSRRKRSASELKDDDGVIAKRDPDVIVISSDNE